MVEGVRILTAKQAEIAKTALALLAMRTGGPSDQVTSAMEALDNPAPDLEAEVKRLRGLLRRSLPYVADMPTPEADDLSEEILTALPKEATTDA